MSDIELPDHPVAHINLNGVIHEAGYDWLPVETLTPLFTADQLRAAILADREKRAQAAQQHAPCKGENCGITQFDQEHSPECIAEHERAYSGAELDTAGNRHPEFRYAGYKSQPLQNGATADQKLAYEEGKRAQFTEASKTVQAEAPCKTVAACGNATQCEIEGRCLKVATYPPASKQAEAPTASAPAAEREPLKSLTNDEIRLVELSIQEYRRQQLSLPNFARAIIAKFCEVNGIGTKEPANG